VAVSGRGETALILDDIKNKLLEIDPTVYYGMVDDEMRETVWDYTVFHRKPTKIGANRTGYSYHFSVNVVRENFIPEGLDLEIIAKMLEIPGMRLAGNDMEYNYIAKPGTNVVVEMLSIDFVKPVKV
jgi:hypothetical protein